ADRRVHRRVQPQRSRRRDGGVRRRLRVPAGRWPHPPRPRRHPRCVLRSPSAIARARRRAIAFYTPVVALPARVASVVLVTRDETVCGVLPFFEVETPWWHDVGPVVREIRKRHAIDVTVLRILDVELGGGGGGAVTYLAEVAAPVAAPPWTGTLDEHPLRMPWARPGGPARDLAWADSLLAARGMRRSGPAEQVRTWNLSSIWRLPVDGQTVWLKAVPPFFAHEGRMLARLQGGPVPVVLGHDDGRVLMADIPGDDLYKAPSATLQEMAALLVGLQREWSGRTDELLALGLPDWRTPALARAIASVIERMSDALSTEDRETLARFAQRLPDRLAAAAACGLPQTLVHGALDRK